MERQSSQRRSAASCSSVHTMSAVSSSGRGSVRLLDERHVGGREERGLEQPLRVVGVAKGVVGAVGEDVEVAGADGQVFGWAVDGYPAEALGGFDVEYSVHGYNTVLGLSFLIL